MRLFLTFCALLAVATAGATAQSAKPRVAGIAPAPKPEAPRDPQRMHHRRRGVSVIVTTDGRYYVDVGYGWEPVVRSCSGRGGATAPAGPGGTHTPDRQALPEYRLPTYSTPDYTPTATTPESTPLAPAQRNAPERALPQNQGASNPPASTTAVPPTCWITDPRGQTFVVTP